MQTIKLETKIKLINKQFTYQAIQLELTHNFYEEFLINIKITY